MKAATLPAVDFSAVAQKGCFVYCYLDEITTRPYYIGISSRKSRPFEAHGACDVPANKSLVRVMRSGLSWEKAQEWEVFYIAKYGRIASGTGVLTNKTEGGEGSVGFEHSEESKRLMSDHRKGKPAWNKGVPMSEEQKAILSAVRTELYSGPLDEEVRTKISQSLKGVNTWSKGRTASKETRAKMSAAHKGKTFSEESNKKKATSRLAHTAAKHGVNPDDWAALTPLQRNSMYRWLKRRPKMTPADYIAHILDPQ